MTSRISTFLVLPLLALLLATPAQKAAAQCLAPGFEGRWHGNDGGSYRIYWSGSKMQWDGRSGDNGKSWVNRFVGTLKGDVLTGEWQDRGKPWGHGTMTVRMVNDHLLVRTASTGSFFSGTRWTRPVPSHGCNDTAANPG